MSASRESAERRSNISEHSTHSDKATHNNSLVEAFSQLLQGKPSVSDLTSIFSPYVLSKPTVNKENSVNKSTNNTERNARERSISCHSEKGTKRRKSQTMGIDSTNNEDSCNVRESRSISVDSEDRDRRQKEDLYCTLCDRKFATKSNIFKHYRGFHKEMSPERVHDENIAKGTSVDNNAVKNAANKGKEQTFDEKEKEGKPDCKLCGAVFNSVSSRNYHYRGKHQIIHEERWIFFHDSTAIIKSSFERLISLNPDWFKAKIAAAKSNDSTVCKLCKLYIQNYNDEELNYHYNHDHKVNRSVVEQLVSLKYSDFEEIPGTHKLNNYSVTFDVYHDEQHSKSHTDEFRNVSVEARVESDMLSEQIDCENTRDLYRKQVKSPTPKLVEVKKAEVTKNAEVERTWRASFTPTTAPLMFLCRTCKLATGSYDNAVAHCQDHILELETQTHFCEICKLKFANDFETHKQLHLADDDVDRESFKFVKYDHHNLMSDTWMDMFDMMSKAKVKRIISASVYFATRCVRMKLERDSVEASERFTLFKCVTCQTYVDPQSITTHVGQWGACANEPSYPCASVECQKPFFTQTAMEQHATTHQLPNADRKYRTVLFNDQADLKLNKILLQASVRSENENGSSDVRNEAPDKILSHSQVETQANKVSTDIDDMDKVADVYKCQCGLCFDRLEFLFNHLQNCPPALEIARKTCHCGLVFDMSNYDYHCKVHCDGVTVFKVKEVIIRMEKTLDVRGMAEEFRNSSEKAAPKVVFNDREETDGKMNSSNSDASKEQQEEINLQMPEFTKAAQIDL